MSNEIEDKSDTRSTSDSESESTISEPIPLEKVLESLNNGAKDAIAEKDYLSYSTLLDIQLHDPSRYTEDEREKLMGCVLEILQSNDSLVYEIGWDIPSIIIPYIESSFVFNSGIRDAPCVYKILKIFEILATKGNPKELFLKSCELMGTLTVSDDSSIDFVHRENFFEIKMYNLNELMATCLRKIPTLYPSRLLAMTVGSYVNLIYNLHQIPVSRSTYVFVLKRAYSFARNYDGAPKPANVDYSETELSKIQNDENYLIRKLLTGFITNMVYMGTTAYTAYFSMTHFYYLQNESSNFLKTQEPVDTAIYDRFYELAYSFDLPLASIFAKFVEDSKKFVYGIKHNGDDFVDLLFEKCVVDYQANLMTSIVDSDAKSINDSVLGEIILFTQFKAVNHTFEAPLIKLSDVISLALRLLIPQMVQKTFLHKSLQDLVLFWIWYALQQIDLKIDPGYNAKIDLVSVPQEYLPVFFQSLIFVFHHNEVPRFRYMILTLLTKLLIVTPESIGYDFIKDTIENCPFEVIRPALIGIYKELLLNSRSDIDSVNFDLKKVTLNEENQTSNAPELPPRKVKTTSKYYALTDEKFGDILEWVLLAQSNAFVENEQEVKIDPFKLSTLASILNLLVVLKKTDIAVANKNKMEKVLKSVDRNIEFISKSGSSNQYEKNAAGMLGLTIERIRE
ncbi:hypothetical protein CANMA_001275 [Candida margitis]|uniref:uncharacterized protein n=1 Tax=Candida margitis TaxID=1775924 RepID=UPI0022280635|nr:uncharacterized protein CANMA_001275 [Candida margitis]KAI5969612.1 hypothetical protein CANMA_001275 [Candida margitis]